MSKPNVTHECDYYEKEDGTMVWSMKTTVEVPEELVPEIEKELTRSINRQVENMMNTGYLYGIQAIQPQPFIKINAKEGTE